MVFGQFTWQGTLALISPGSAYFLLANGRRLLLVFPIVAFEIMHGVGLGFFTDPHPLVEAIPAVLGGHQSAGVPSLFLQEPVGGRSQSRLCKWKLNPMGLALAQLFTRSRHDARGH